MGVFTELNNAVTAIGNAKTDILNSLSEKGAQISGNEGFSKIPAIISGLSCGNNVAKGTLSVASDTEEISISYALDQAPNFFQIWTTSPPFKSNTIISLVKSVNWQTYSYCFGSGVMTTESDLYGNGYGFLNITKDSVTVKTKEGYCFRATATSGAPVVYNWIAAVL